MAKYTIEDTTLSAIADAIRLKEGSSELIAVLEMAQRIAETDISGIWNFTGQELDAVEDNIVVENVHLGDSLMTLNYRIANKE